MIAILNLSLDVKNTNFQKLLSFFYKENKFQIIYRKLFQPVKESYNLNNADIILSTSKVMAKEIRKLTDNKNIKITPFGIDTKKFKNYKTSELNNIITIGTIKTLSEIYGIDILIKSFALARKKLFETNIALAKRMRLKIVGSGEQKKFLLDLILSLGISDISIIKDRVKHKRSLKDGMDLSVAFAEQEENEMVKKHKANKGMARRAATAVQKGIKNFFGIKSKSKSKSKSGSNKSKSGSNKSSSKKKK